VDGLTRELGVEHTASAQATRDIVRAVLAEARASIHAGHPAPTHTELAHLARVRLRTIERPALRPVINATGIILNTNLGRAPLSAAASAAMLAIGASYSNLEYDLAEGERGSRQAHVHDLLTQLTGAEDALVVNNNAAAVLVVLSALAMGREVIISRGELVEIGGGFRVPDVMRQSGARLIEVGTTNRTRVADYHAAITTETALLLSVQPSNFRVVGFTEAPPLSALAALAHARDLPLVHDLGSGCLLSTDRWELAHEPTPQESLAAGADIVCFSGDKLMGGPQAGIMVGRQALLAPIKRHPLMRALRIDKLTLAALEATLRHYLLGEAEREIPVWRMISAPADVLTQRAAAWAEAARGWGIEATTVSEQSWIGGGSLPGAALPTTVCRLCLPPEARSPALTTPLAPPHSPTIPATTKKEIGDLSSLLRQQDPPVVARVQRDKLFLDPRTVLPEQDPALLSALHTALTSLLNS
jgi:L-seryl-tRNA(Ser) seleniumtransferase